MGSARTPTTPDGRRPMLPSGTFAGRACVVTGGTSGIGLAIAERLAVLGASVAVLGRDPERVDDAVATATTADGSMHGRAVDVRDRAGVERVFAEIAHELGPVRHLVNAAAGNFRAAPEDLSPGGWRAVTDIVLDGTWNCTQVFAQPLLATATPGSVVSIGSSKAHAGGPDTVPSAAAKAGVNALTKSLAIAWGPAGIRLNVVTPGVTTGTGAISQLFAQEGSLEQDLAKVPTRRHTTLDEVSDAVTFLLSDFAGSATGAELVLDGGRSLGIG